MYQVKYVPGTKYLWYYYRKHIHTYYKVHPREVPSGVAEERSNARMKYLHTC